MKLLRSMLLGGVMMCAWSQPAFAAEATTGMCRIPQQPTTITCETGGNFLCVNTPPRGVAGDSFLLRGIVERTANVLGGIEIAVQHDYTHHTERVNTSQPASADCWNDTLGSHPFCIDAQGKFSARVPLSSAGPFTILVSASRFAGDTVEEVVKTSRVVPFQIPENAVTFDPNVVSQTAIAADNVTVNVKLLEHCTFCDFIGASTGGVTVTVTNVIRERGHEERRISCTNAVEQGGSGAFVIGIPVGAGENQLTITACNAATGASCPTLGDITFTGSTGQRSFTLLTPPPAPAYSAREYPLIHWSFTLGSGTACVDVAFNRDPLQSICPDASGVYQLQLTPRVGINLATISHDGITIPWAFGWGEIESPFAKDAKGLVIRKAAALAIPTFTATDMMQPLLSNYVDSDEMTATIARLVDGMGSPREDEAEELRQQGNDAIPGCKSDGGLSGLGVRLRGTPSIGKARVEGMRFSSGQIDLIINADDLFAGINLIKDEDHNGVPDEEPLPLSISFKKALIELALKVGRDDSGKPLLLLTSPHTDCDFKSATYCTGKPAPLIPRNFVGNASPLGHFVSCDRAAAAPDVDDLCSALNSLNAQTGVMSEKVLDAINETITCKGSRQLTALARDGLFGRLPLNFLEREASPLEIPFAVSLGGGITIDSRGIAVGTDVIFGDRSFFAAMPQELKLSSVGVIRDAASHDGSFDDLITNGWKLSVEGSTGLINGMLFTLAAAGGRGGEGLFPLDLHESAFKKLGYDFVTKCDATEQRDALCNIRPRVGELLGTPLLSYGYFSNSKQPLMMRIWPNAALPPRVALVQPAEVPPIEGGRGGENGEPPAPTIDDLPTGALVELQVGGLELSFYALEIDATLGPDTYGNLPIRFDQEGKPLIHSMRPDDPDPTHGQIITFDVNLLLVLELSQVMTDPNDPSHSLITLRPLANRSRLVLTAIDATNATTIPAANLAQALEEKLNIALAAFSPREKAIPLRLAKKKEFERDDEHGGIFPLLGIKRIDFGSRGLGLEFDSDHETITLGFGAVISQLLHHDGQVVEETLPH